MAFYVDANSKLAKPLEITAHTATRQVFSFTLEGWDKKDVCHDLVLPSLSETKLLPPQQSSERPAASEDARHCVDAFFAKKVDDQGIDVHAEGQLIMREMLNPVNASSRWDCNVNPL